MIKTKKILFIIYIMVFSILFSCSGNGHGNSSLKYDALWDKIALMQKQILEKNQKNNKRKIIRKKSGSPAVEPLDLEQISHDLPEAHKIQKALKSKIKNLIKAVMDYKKTQKEDREFKKTYVQKIYSRILVEALKWQMLQTAESDNISVMQELQKASKAYDVVRSH